MILKEIVARLNLDVKSGTSKLDNEVKCGYASDIISDVMANSRQGDLWITFQTHVNMVAVASLKDLAGVVVVNGRVPDEETLKKADEEEVPILISKQPTFEVVGQLYNLGISGKR